jgi:hypothetical protein
MKDAQIQFIKEERDRSAGVYKDLHESSFAAAKGHQGRDRRCHAWIKERMDTLEKLRVYAEQQVAELDDAHSKFAVEAASNEVVRDAMAFFKKKRKRKSKWGGDRKSTKFLAIAMEFATNDCKGATSIEDGGMRASTMMSMASSNAIKCDKELTDAQRLSVALQKLRSSASVVPQLAYV